MKIDLNTKQLISRKSRPVLLTALLLVMIMMPLSAVSAGPLNYAFTTIYINDLDDDAGDCSNTAPGGNPSGAIGSCTLRAAIAEANSGLGPDVIELDDEAVRKIIAAGGTLELVLTGNIPAITESLSIDLMYKNPNSGVENNLPIKGGGTEGGFVFQVDADTSSLSNVILQDISGNGIRVLADDVSLSGILIEDTGGGLSAGHGVTVSAVSNFSLTDADISGHADGVRLSSVTTASLSNLIVGNNTGNGVSFLGKSVV